MTLERLSKRKNKGDYVKLDPVIHPLVRRHPSTKKPSLFLSPHTMVSIVDYDYNEGRELLDYLTCADTSVLSVDEPIVFSNPTIGTACPMLGKNATLILF